MIELGRILIEGSIVRIVISLIALESGILIRICGNVTLREIVETGIIKMDLTILISTIVITTSPASGTASAPRIEHGWIVVGGVSHISF